MKKELDEQLVKDFPNLYKDRHSSIMSSCMGWGFDCGDGWEPLIRRLSEKLEKEIIQIKKENPKVSCRVCSCSYDDHARFNKQNKCLNVHKIKTYYLFRRKYLGFIVLPTWLRSTLNKLLELFFYKLKVCHCDNYDANYPRVVQVKEKFATLRYYMSASTDKMEDMIREAEQESAVTCEECGQPGVCRSGGWLKTLCDKCATEEDGSVRKPYGVDDEY